MDTKAYIKQYIDAINVCLDPISDIAFCNIGWHPRFSICKERSCERAHRASGIIVLARITGLTFWANLSHL